MRGRCKNTMTEVLNSAHFFGAVNLFHNRLICSSSICPNISRELQLCSEMRRWSNFGKKKTLMTLWQIRSSRFRDFNLVSRCFTDFEERWRPNYSLNRRKSTSRIPGRRLSIMRGSCCVKGHRIIVFTADANPNRLRPSTTVFSDGTFYWCRVLFT